MKRLVIVAALVLHLCGPDMSAKAGTTGLCPGDCTGDRLVTVSELIVLVNIATDRAALSQCPVLFAVPRIDYLVQSVNHALQGCPVALPTPSPAPTKTAVPFGHPCHDREDCDSRQFCLEPGGFLGCGVCTEDEWIDDNFRRCEADRDCQGLDATPRCEPFGDATHTCRACAGDVSVCIQPECSTNIDCDSPDICEQYRCVGRLCIADHECPARHQCAFGFGNKRRCERRPCATDAECGEGFCVNRLCYLELGRCLLLPS